MTTTKDYAKVLDWQSVIAAATLENKLSGKVESYLYRGIARCFTLDKDGKHKEAIEDLSKAIYYLSNPVSQDNTAPVEDIDKAYYYRAYAFYLDGDYQKAIADCQHITQGNPCCICNHELLGKIYHALNDYQKAVTHFECVIRQYMQQTMLPTPSLLDSYREDCRRMNNV